MRIGLDCDGVLYNFEKQARYLIKSEFGIDLPVSKSWNFIQESVSPEQWDWLWSADGGLYDLFDGGDAYPQIAEAVNSLRKIGDVVVITSIPRCVIPDRLYWLVHNGVVFDEFRLVNGMKEKSKVIPLCDVYIDDSSEVAEDILNHTNASMILWRRPWNMGENAPQNTRPYFPVNTWEEVIDLVKDLV